MEERITALCQRFMENGKTVKKVFWSESSEMVPIASNALTAQGVTADEARLKECIKIVRKNAGSLSFLNGLVAAPFAVSLSMKDDPEASFEKVERLYSVIKKQFGRSDFSALLAIQLSDFVSEESMESVVGRGRELYRLMKEKHPFLTSENDSVLAGFLALSEKSNAALMDDMEACYELLKNSFSDKDSIQTVSHILSIGAGSAREKVDHMIELYDGLKEAGRKFGTDYLAILAAVSILDDNNEKLRDTILEIDGFLETQKGYGFWGGFDKKIRLMHAAMLTIDLYNTAINSQASANAYSLAMIAAQQTAICCMIAAMIIIASAAAVTTPD
ncbi:MAG: DUF4003 family protein [Clostridia bacterium]|nr:DUF4003 family protein [Clostridia bacterium]